MKKGFIVLFIITILFPCIANATYHLSSFSVQNRTYEDGNQLNRLAFEVQDANNQYISTNVLGSVVLTDPNGKNVNINTPVRFATSYETNCYYDANTGEYIYQPFYFYSYYATEFPEQFVTGTYHLVFTDLDGEISQKDFVFNGIVDLPIIPSSSFMYYRDQDGNFIWQWQVPNIDPNIGVSTSVRVWISIYGEQGEYIGGLYVKVPTQLGQLIVPKDVFDQALTMGKTFKLATQVRTDDNNNRAYSTEVTLPELLPQPTACTATLNSNFLLHIPYITYANGTLSLWADLAYEYNPMYPTMILFKLTTAGFISNPSFSCTASTLSDDLKVHIPDVLFPDGVTHIWVDLEYVPTLSSDGNAYFFVTDYGDGQ